MDQEDRTNDWMWRVRKKDEPSQLPGAALEMLGIRTVDRDK